jgi:sec-independent protein translocase protein TatA
MLAEIFSPEILGIVLIVVILLFGGSKLPQLARGLGSAKSEFEKASREGKDDTDKKA